MTEAETEIRGQVYEKIGRTYLFDLDGYHISHPPEGLKDIDPRAHELAMIVKKRADAAIEREREAAGLSDDEDPQFTYSAYSGELKGQWKH